MPSHTTGALTGARSPKAQPAPLPKRRSDQLPARTLPSKTLQSLPSDDAELHRIRDALDHAAHASLARLTSGLSPAAVFDAYMDWAVNLAISPGKQVELATKAARKWARLAQFPSRCASGGGTMEPVVRAVPPGKRL